MENEKILVQNEDFLKKTYRAALLPCMLSILSSNINILVDGIVVGQKLGVDGLAALNLCMPIYLVLCVIGSFIVSGAAITASAAIGRDRQDEAQELYRLSIGLCLAASVIVTALGLLFLDGIAAFLAPDEVLRPMVKTYSGVTIAGSFVKIFLYVPFWFLRLDGRNRNVMISTIIMTVTNIVLDYLFLYPLNMGVMGAALASVLATALAVGMGFWHLCDKKSSFRFGIRLRASKEQFAAVRASGTPNALNNLVQTLRVLAVNSILASYGNNLYLAMFAAVNCVSEFSLCLVSGIPQAAMAMLGVYHGEHDTGSTGILMKLEWEFGRKYALVFGAVIVGGAGLIARLYGLDASLYLPMLFLALSVFPAIINSIFLNYYNVSGHNTWANAIITARVFLFAVAGLGVLRLLHLSPWAFPLIGDLATLLAWYLTACLFHKKHPQFSKYLLVDEELEKEKKTLDFSVGGTMEEICDASSRISEFCEENGMSMRQVMHLSLSMEELMTMIVTQNGKEHVNFDLRLFTLQGHRGIRMRYNGILYNPFGNQFKMENDEAYLGVNMIQNIAENVFYQRLFGMNLLQIQIKDN